MDKKTVATIAYLSRLSLNEKNEDKITNDLENIIRRYSPIIPLYYDMSVRIVPKNISGLEANAINQLNLKRVIKKL